MRVLLDTNVLLRSVRKDHPQSRAALDAVLSLASQRHELCVVPQVLHEFWVVATRPLANNGLGLSCADAKAHVDRLLAAYTLLEDSPGLTLRWLGLVAAHAVIGKNAHDARLVAAMQSHGVTHLLTFNVGDFGRFPDLSVTAPGSAPPAPHGNRSEG